jgi:predicted HicB family RNase H-like nuclease
MPDKPNERRLNVRVDEEVHRRLRVEAASHDTTIQELVEAWLREKLKMPALPPDEGKKGGEVACAG